MAIVDVSCVLALAALMFAIEMVFKWRQRRRPIGTIFTSETGTASGDPAVPHEAPVSHHHAGGHWDMGGHGGHGGGGHGH